MIIKKNQPKIPSMRFRHSVYWGFYNKFLNVLKKKKNTLFNKDTIGHMILTSKKKKKYTPNISINFVPFCGVFITYRYFLNFSNFKCYIYLKNIFNIQKYFLSLSTTYLKQKLNFLYSHNLWNNQLLNNFCRLDKIPSYYNIIYLQNSILSKFTYSLSIGSVSYKIKYSKNGRLVLIRLPSGLEKYFNKNLICIFGELDILYDVKLKKGKFGSLLKNQYKINVRGVAKNPVDHPNGGRTKSKQPEKSPWGWIAKCNK